MDTRLVLLLAAVFVALLFLRAAMLQPGTCSDGEDYFLRRITSISLNFLGCFLSWMLLFEMRAIIEQAFLDKQTHDVTAPACRDQRDFRGASFQRDSEVQPRTTERYAKNFKPGTSKSPYPSATQITKP